MQSNKYLEPFSFGVGDHFTHQAKAQLPAFEQLAQRGVDVAPVWNKSHREHTSSGSQLHSAFAAAEQVVTKSGWNGPFNVDAGHIRRDTVEGFLATSDFFTLDVANFIAAHPELSGSLHIEGLVTPFRISRAEVELIADQYLLTVQGAGELYHHIAAQKGAEE